MTASLSPPSSTSWLRAGPIKAPAGEPGELQSVQADHRRRRRPTEVGDHPRSTVHGNADALRDSGPVSSNSTRGSRRALRLCRRRTPWWPLSHRGPAARPAEFVVGRRALHRRADVLFVHPASKRYPPPVAVKLMVVGAFHLSSERLYILRRWLSLRETAPASSTPGFCAPDDAPSTRSSPMGCGHAQAQRRLCLVLCGDAEYDSVPMMWTPRPDVPTGQRTCCPPVRLEQSIETRECQTANSPATAWTCPVCKGTAR